MECNKTMKQFERLLFPNNKVPIYTSKTKVPIRTSKTIRDVTSLGVSKFRCYQIFLGAKKLQHLTESIFVTPNIS